MIQLIRTNKRWAILFIIMTVGCSTPKLQTPINQNNAIVKPDKTATMETHTSKQNRDKGVENTAKGKFKIAEAGSVDLDALLNETQKMGKKADAMTMAWWIPAEFWQVSFAKDPKIQAAQTEEFIEVFSPYLLIVAMDGKVGTFGGITYKSEKNIRNSIRVTDNRGNYYRPMDQDRIDANTKNLLSAFKPLMSNMLGPMGKNMNFYLFPAKNKYGDNIADATKEGSFSVTFNKNVFEWNLPLGSLIRAKTCPIDGEKLNGAWKFCPWHGVELKY